MWRDVIAILEGLGEILVVAIGMGVMLFASSVILWNRWSKKPIITGRFSWLYSHHRHRSLIDAY